jgi:VIT1/CCC1 family predicted Fe2+/Mn2+ transporter
VTVKPGEELAHWRHEMDSAWLYRVVAAAEKGTPREKLFLDLAREAESQAAVWAKPAEPYRPGARVRVVARLIRWFGPRRLKPVLAAMKVRGLSVYSKADPGHPFPRSLADVGRRHHTARSGGNLRAAVFGVNDGLVSNASLILGVTGASMEPSLVVLSGAAGLLAGAFSMAAGEYVSVRSQREMYEHQIAQEKDELERYPEEEAAELALVFEARGLAPQDARRTASRLVADPARALDTLAREELGLDPDDLASPWGAAIFSFLAFGAGAAVPLLPFLLDARGDAVAISIAVTATSLFAVGAVLSLFTGRNALWSGLRMLLVGAAAGAATWGIGRGLGVSLG